MKCPLFPWNTHDVDGITKEIYSMNRLPARELHAITLLWTLMTISVQFARAPFVNRLEIGDTC